MSERDHNDDGDDEMEQDEEPHKTHSNRSGAYVRTRLPTYTGQQRRSATPVSAASTKPC